METLLDKVKRLEKLANPIQVYGPATRERFLNKSTAAPAIPADHIIPLRQELERLREGLNEALYIIKDLSKIN